MKKFIFIILAASLSIGCNDSVIEDVSHEYKGLLITEVAANTDKLLTDTWVEVYNPTSADIDLTGLGLFIFDENSNGEELTIMDNMTARAGERLVFTTADYSLVRGFASDSDFKIVLGTSATEGIVDEFSRAEDGNSTATPRFGSYQRIPENGDWQITAQATKRIRNFDAKPNGIWVWSTHMNQWIADDFAVLKKMKQLGYDHILLNYNAFDDPTAGGITRRLIAAAKQQNLKVHAWMQVFKEKNSWVNPIENLGGGQGRYKQEEFDRIIAKAQRYVDEFDVDGIHLDYVRFSGVGANLANSNNYSNGVTAAGAITEFCRQLRAAIDSRLEGVILSAAMMTGANAVYYYGQDAYEMGKYIDILMPMAYKYYANTTYDDNWVRGTCATFTQATSTQVWAGIQTYTHVPGTENVIGSEASVIRADAEVIRDTKCSGVVLFRYALGEFPDVNDLWSSAK